MAAGTAGVAAADGKAGAAGADGGVAAAGVAAGWFAGTELVPAPGTAESAAASDATRAEKTSQTGRER